MNVTSASISVTNIASQFVRFLLIGGFATIIHYAILIGLVAGGILEVVTASSVGFCISSFINYAMNRRFTFNSTAVHSRALPKFMIVAALGLIINSCIVWSVHYGFELHYLLAQACATFISIIWNFSANRKWSFA